MQLFDDKAAPYQIHFDVFGVGMRIATNTPELLQDVEGMLLPGWRRRPRFETDKRLALVGDDQTDMYSIYRYDGALIHHAPGRDYALVMLDSQIHGHVALEALNYVFIHAGVVGNGDRAIVIPGMSFSGKTTLVRALVEAGATYYSDEFAVLDESGLVHPYPRRLSIRPLLVGDSTTISDPTIETTVEELGGIAGVDPLPVGMVIATHYRPRAEWEPQQVSGAARALTLLQHAVPAQDRPEQTLRYITRAVSGAVTLEGPRGDADELAPRLLDTLRAAA